jgi:hypothetical protein
MRVNFRCDLRVLSDVLLSVDRLEEVFYSWDFRMGFS